MRTEPVRHVSQPARRRARWLGKLGRSDLSITEVRCAAGWFCPSLKSFGRVTPTDLSEGVFSRTRQRIPDVNFITGDFMTLDFPARSFDVVITFEVLAHVADQKGFGRPSAGP